MSATRHVVVVGNGMAGARIAAALSTRDTATRLQITVLGAESTPAYHRVLLGDVLTGALRASDIAVPTPSTVDVRLGKRVTRIDPVGSVVHCGSGSVRYDALVLATGAAPVIPPLTGLPGGDIAAVAGIHVMRGLADYETLRAALVGARRVVVVGGGPLGVETACAVASRGIPTTVVTDRTRLLGAVTDDVAADTIRRTLHRRGISVHTGVAVTGVRTDHAAAVTGVRLVDGRVVDADLVVLACGVRPAVSVARHAGLALGRHGGVVVDDTLRTAPPHIYAIGDCAEHRGMPGDQVASAWAQAAVLADRLSGHDPTARYRGVPRTFRLRADLGVAAIGDCVASPGGPAAEVVELFDAARGTYRKAVIRDGQLAGALLVGDVGAVGTLTDYHAHGTALPPQPLDLLCPRWNNAAVPEVST